MPKIFPTLLFPLVLFSCGPAPHMPEYKSASIELLHTDDEKSFFLLPPKGTVETKQKLWSGNYWRSNKGSINFRWNSPRKERFDYPSPTRDEIIFMTPEAIAALSPSEKFDLLHGRYEYSLKQEVYSSTNRSSLNWDGLQEGVTLASVHHNEPTPKVLLNPDGIPVPFGSSDIKGLLSYYYTFFGHSGVVDELGKKQVLNPGVFHAVLANKVGRRKEPLIIDTDQTKEVWNLPVESYSSAVMSESRPTMTSPIGTVRVLRVLTKVIYVGELKANSWDPVLGTPLQSQSSKEYSYDLFLNLKNDIIGGQWRSEEHPDFIWSSRPVNTFKGLFEGLDILLND